MDDKRQTDSSGVIEYEIRVASALDPSWSDTLGGIALGHETGANGQRVTILRGALDQAALAGVMDALFSLGLTVLSVRGLEQADASVQEPAAPGGVCKSQGMQQATAEATSIYGKEQRWR